MFYILVAIIMFGILIALHEFGHFIAAKACGVKVNEFAIGMGPKLLSKQGKETVYTLRAFPVGGFCAMEGEGDDGDDPDDPRSFSNRPAWQRLIILLAGVTMNFLTGLLIILLLFSSAEGFYTPVVSTVLPDAYAAAQGLQAGDRILRVDGHAIYLQSDISLYLGRSDGSGVELKVKREGVKHDLTVDLTPYTDPETGTERLMLGITLGEIERATLGVKLKNAWFQSIDFVRIVWMSLGDLVTGRVGVRDMSGVVGIVDMVGELGQEGAQAAQEAGESAFLGAMTSILYFGAFIAINLAVMNLLPIPALDGGQIFFLLVDKVYGLFTHKRIDPKYLGYINTAGLVCLLALMAVIAVSDIFKLFGK